MPDLRATSKSDCAVALDVRGEEDVRRVDDGFAQRLLANAQLGAEQVAAVELEQVEGDERDGMLGRDAAHIDVARDIDALLHALERGLAFGVEDHQLSVDDRLAGVDAGPDRLGLRVMRRLVVAAPSADAHLRPRRR